MRLLTKPLLRFACSLALTLGLAVPAVASAQDTDGDTVNDSADYFPCDPLLSEVELGPPAVPDVPRQLSCSVAPKVPTAVTSAAIYWPTRYFDGSAWKYAGTTQALVGSKYDVGARRLLASTLGADTAFGTNGNGATFDAYGLDETAGPSAVMLDGKIVSFHFADYQTGTNWQERLVIARHNADGTLDTTFGTNGIIKETLVSSSGSSKYVNTAFRMPDNKIMLFGYSGSSLGNGYGGAMVLKFNPDGSRDTTFGGGDGEWYSQRVSDKIWAATLGPDGMAYVTGWKEKTTTNVDAFVARFTNQGLDTTFGVSGYAFFGWGTAYWAGGTNDCQTRIDDGHSIAFDDAGRILVGGRSAVDGCLGETYYPSYIHFVARLNPNGTIDTTFGNAGRVNMYDRNGGASRLITKTVARPLGDGRILVMGSQEQMAPIYSGCIGTGSGNWIRPTFWLVNEDGSIDPTFVNAKGKPICYYGGGDYYPTLLFIEADGTFTMGGGVAGSGLVAFASSHQVRQSALQFESTQIPARTKRAPPKNGCLS